MTYLPNLKYIPDNLESIDGKTLLAKGVPLSIFMPNSNLKHITTIEEKQQIVRNLLPQAEIYNYFKNNTSLFADYKLKVVGGFYKPKDQQSLTPNSVLDLQSRGRAVVYELLNNGKVDIDKTIDAVYYIAAFNKYFDKIILDYDNYSNNRDLTSQIIITMPEIDDNYSVTFKRDTETRFNGETLGKDLIKIETEITPGISAGSNEEVHYTQPDLAVGDNGNLDPNDLMDIGNGKKLRKDAAIKFLEMSDAAKAEGVSFKINSAYRTAEYQGRLFQNELRKRGSVEETRKWVAPPGKSNHGWGITIDVGDIYGIRSTRAARGNKQYEWLRANGPRFGFAQRMEWEPWHWEYYGDKAKDVKLQYK